ncbi:hypothetical protein ACSVDM_00940 [Nocardia sp. JW2]|uniref:hypothetical protein n=1 Tax=Nocardia sp. JW2 TaxID=3450738 RepID=UPI003F42E46A
MGGHTQPSSQGVSATAHYSAPGHVPPSAQPVAPPPPRHSAGSASNGGPSTGSTVDVHGNYRAGRITHEAPDALVSDVVTMKVLLPHLLRLIPIMILTVLLFFAAILVTIAIALEGASNGSSSDGGFGVFLFILFAIFIMWIVVLCMPLRESISEYGLLIEGRAPALALSYAWITRTHRDRQAPFGVKFGRVTGVPVLLMFGERRVQAMIVVRAVGTDLYVGWSMWRSRSTAVVLGHLIRDIFQSSTHLILASEMRTASTRSLRELVHSLTREGVQAAIIAPPVSIDEAAYEVAQLPDLSSGQQNFLAPPTTSMRG